VYPENFAVGHRKKRDCLRDRLCEQYKQIRNGLFVSRLPILTTIVQKSKPMPEEKIVGFVRNWIK
ncbi:MAG: hypothetical protein AAF206_23905, partial [Bacteroidota bacterium]